MPAPSGAGHVACGFPEARLRRHRLDRGLPGITGEVAVLPAVRPGDVRNALPQSPPEPGESMDEILGDFQKIIVPANTHWNHPDFMAYFANSATGAGVLGRSADRGAQRQRNVVAK